jgi:hypothetical protein
MSNNDPFEYVKENLESILNDKSKDDACYELKQTNYPDVVFTKTRKKEAVNHPEHYTPGVYEAINVIEEWKLDFHLGNAVKYISRAGKKDPSKTEEDLRKAIWYIERYIQNKHRKNF